MLFLSDRKHRDHLLQSLLHLRIHIALQKIEHNSVAVDRPQVLRRQEFVQNGQNELQNTNNEDTTGSADEDFFDAEEDCVNLCRQDSNSSFDIISDFADEA